MKVALRQLPILAALTDDQIEDYCKGLHGKIIALGLFKESEGFTFRESRTTS